MLNILLAIIIAVDTAIYGKYAREIDVSFNQCDRQCREKYGFYARNITGVQSDSIGFPDINGKFCACFVDKAEIGKDTTVEIYGPVEWDESFWCGNFKTSNVCVLNPNSDVPSTVTKDRVGPNDVILHCGSCGACSNRRDAEIMYRTKTNITTLMTACAAKFAKPMIVGGDKDLPALRKCLIDAGITFSQDGRSWAEPENKPTCMDCWTDNIQCDGYNCRLDNDCIKKFLDPSNSGVIDGCLKCDEVKCGPQFIKCSGANRRSLGIESDIERHSNQICTSGYYFGRK